MIVKSLELSNFRNYESLDISFSPQTNILFGNNAQGKTNILEAVYLGGTTKSHRGSKDKEMIKWDNEEAHIRLKIERNGIEHKIDMHLKQNKTKGVAIDGIPIKKASEIFNIINVVSFSPEDLSVIKDGPAERRRFIDMELCKLDKLYLYNLANYNKVLNQRNILLKQISFKPELEETLIVWDKQLVSFGQYIITARTEFIKELNDINKDVHKKLTDGKEEVNLIYEANVKENDFQDRIRASFQRDIMTKMTNTGPHRDDLCLYVNGKDVRKFGSQGQQRTAALALKLSEIELIKLKIKDLPVILLDDVLSELDRTRQQQLLKSIEGVQTIITCTGLEEFVNDRIISDSIYKVTNGAIEKIDNL